MKELGAAMAKAQAEIKAAIKDSQGQVGTSRNYRYADLASVWDACRVALTKNGLSVIQTTDFDKDEVWLVTTLLHSSGDSIASRYPLRPQQHTPQGYGSSLTYARRYCLASIVGVVSDEDDDGAAASQRGDREPPPRPTQATRDPVYAAKSYVDEAIKAIGTLTDAAGLNAWVEANKSKLERLRDVYDEGSRQVSGAILEQRKSLMRGAAE